MFVDSLLLGTELMPIVACISQHNLRVGEPRACAYLVRKCVRGHMALDGRSPRRCSSGACHSREPDASSEHWDESKHRPAEEILRARPGI